MSRLVRNLACFFLAAGVHMSANAVFHLWQISEVFSNSDGTVQFIELTAQAGGQQFLSGHTITSASGGTTKSFSFASNLPGDSSGKTMLIGTPAFAAISGAAPDYQIPSGFLFTSNGTINFAESSDVFSYAVLPTDGTLSLMRSGSAATNSPRNFLGNFATISATDYAGAWFNPSESGWGLSIIRGASGAFGVIMYNFNQGRAATWYFMAGGALSGTVYTAPVTLSTGPFFGEPFSAAPVAASSVGNVTITFTTATTGTISYTISGVAVSKSIQKIQF